MESNDSLDGPEVESVDMHRTLLTPGNDPLWTTGECRWEGPSEYESSLATYTGIEVLRDN